MVSLLEERRLIMRVYGAWKILVVDGFPHPSQIEPESFGSDWTQCLMITLDPTFMRSRFSHIGQALIERNGAMPDEPRIADCQPGNLLDLVTRRIPQIISRKSPLGFGGSLPQNDNDLLYRTVLLPLSEDGSHISGVLGAIAFRAVPVTPEAPISDIAWCNRVVSQELSEAMAFAAAKHGKTSETA